LSGTLRIGVIGLGVISRLYVDALAALDGLRLAAVCDLDDASLGPFRDTVSCHRDYREMLDPGELDAVVITLPNDLHAEACHAALAAGLAVCVEKPLALTVGEGRAIVDLAGSRRLVNFTAFHRRYNSAVRTLVERVSRRGPIESLRVRYWERIEDHVGQDRWYLDPARCGGGCVADNGPNAFDLVRLLLGDLSVVDVDIVRDADGIDRQARVTLAGPGPGPDVRAAVELDWSYDGEVKDILVRFTDGTIDGADMLAGHAGFKGSLRHEYVGVLVDFRDRLRAAGGGGGRTAGEHPGRDGGLAALELVADTYRAEALGIPASRVSSVSCRPGGAP